MEHRLELVVRVLFALFTTHRRSSVEYSDSTDELHRHPDGQPKARIVGVGPPPPAIPDFPSAVPLVSPRASGA